MAQPHYKKKMTKIIPVYSLSPDSSEREVDALQAAGPLLNLFLSLSGSPAGSRHTAGGETAVWTGTDTCPLDIFTKIC